MATTSLVRPNVLINGLIAEAIFDSSLSKLGTYSGFRFSFFFELIFAIRLVVILMALHAANRRVSVDV